jgi:IclR family transcriptional regulator, KDG regulon repressor
MKGAKSAPASPSPAYTVKSLLKALAILDCLGEREPEGYTLTELSQKLRLHISTVHRLLVNLTRQGYVDQNPAKGTYQLGYRVMRMGLKVLDRMDFRRVAGPLLSELSQKTQETVHLAILQGDRAVSIEKFHGPHPVSLDAPLGAVMPLHATGVGKALLAFQDEKRVAAIFRASGLPAKAGLPRLTAHTLTSLGELKRELSRIREQGYAVDDEEAVVGLRCVAAPLFDHSGRAVAAFSVAGPASRVSPSRTPEIARLVLETAGEISHRLGYARASAPVAAS